MDRVLNKGTLTVRQRGRILWGKPFCMIIITKATKSKSKEQFQHGVRIGFLPATMSQKAMAPHSSTLAWKIPWTEEPGGLQSMGSLRVGQDWATSLSLSCIGEGNGNPLQCSCLENPRDGGALWAAVYGVTQSRTWLKWLSSYNNVSVLKGVEITPKAYYSWWRRKKPGEEIKHSSCSFDTLSPTMNSLPTSGLSFLLL